jgi:methionine synthase II (cobalamin-independent)
MDKNGFFDSVSGNRSSARLGGWTVVMIALIFAQEVIYFGRTEVALAAAAAGTIFVTIAGPAMIYLWSNKQTEVKHEEAKQEVAAITKTEITVP